MLNIILEGIWLFALSALDARYRRIPLGLAAAGIPLALWSILPEWVKNGVGWWGIVSCLLPGGILLLAAIPKKAGTGDGIVLILLGLIEWEKGVIGIFFTSMIFMSLFVLVMLLLRRADRQSRFPYLPFLCLSWIVGRAAG